MAGTSSQRSELSLSCICMVSDVRDEDIHDFAKKLVKELVQSEWLSIEAEISIMNIEIEG